MLGNCTGCWLFIASLVTKWSHLYVIISLNSLTSIDGMGAGSCIKPTLTCTISFKILCFLSGSDYGLSKKKQSLFLTCSTLHSTELKLDKKVRQATSKEKGTTTNI